MRKFISKSKAQASALMRKLISPAIRFKLRDTTARFRELLSRACIWRWEISMLPKKFENSTYDLFYAGRKTQRELAQLLLTIDGDSNVLREKPHISNRTVIVSEILIPGALRVPCSLRVVVPLSRPLDEISAGFGDNLRRLIRKNLPRYSMLQTVDDAEIDRANQEMLQPYASARHGTAAAQIAPNEVRRLAKKSGRLDFVLSDDEAVACNLGCEFSMEGKKYWSTIRFGYPAAIYSDPKRLSETNAVSFYLALEWALNNGFDYYDLGNCLGHPENDLLQWKKRWGGELNMIGHHDYFYVRLPKIGTAQFLWDTPLFSTDGKSLTLHLGLPDVPSDDEVAARYRKMSFAGLSKISLHYTKLPSEFLLNKLRGLYSHQKSPPSVEIIECIAPDYALKETI